MGTSHRHPFRIAVGETVLSALSHALWALALLGWITPRAAGQEAKPGAGIVIARDSTQVGKFAAAELSAYLTKLYPSCTFPVTQDATSGKAIFLSVNPAGKDLPESPEGYVVSADAKQASILSKSETGLIYGVYGLLEHLGAGFYV